MSTPKEKIEICELKIQTINQQLLKGFKMDAGQERKKYLRNLYNQRKFWTDEFYRWFKVASLNN